MSFPSVSASHGRLTSPRTWPVYDLHSIAKIPCCRTARTSTCSSPTMTSWVIHPLGKSSCKRAAISRSKVSDGDRKGRSCAFAMPASAQNHFCSNTLYTTDASEETYGGGVGESSIVVDCGAHGNSDELSKSFRLSFPQACVNPEKLTVG